MKTKVWGYARVSSKDQNEARQIEALKDAGVFERDIFVDKQSGKDFARPQYQTLLNCIREGDVVVILSIDRLGRNYDAIMKEWRRITQELGANIRVLDMPLLDTTRGGDSLDGRFIADLVLQILSYVAEKERENIKRRQAQGIATAKAQGKQMGRPRIPLPLAFPSVYNRWKAKEITAKGAMQELGLKPNTFYNFVHQYEAGELNK